MYVHTREGSRITEKTAWRAILQVIEEENETAHLAFESNDVNNAWFPFPKLTLKRLLSDPSRKEVELSNGIVCVRKRIARPRSLKLQSVFFEAFARELNVTSQVKYRHCVQLVGSHTDFDSVAILSLPVADMDLAALLNLPNTRG